jgi:hypothetical protein
MNTLEKRGMRGGPKPFAVKCSIPLRVDDGGLSGFSGTNQAGCVTESLVDEPLDE